jgi:hypothetical protein
MAARTFVILGFMAIGCGGASTDQKIIKSAASRWQCPADKIQVHKLDGDTYRVAGCDHEADYDCEQDDNHPNGACTKVSGT